MKSLYKEAKEAFSENKFDYLKLDDSLLAYNKTMRAVKAKDKMVLVLGKAGVGKTYLLKKVYQDLADKALFYDVFFESRDEFIARLHLDILKKPINQNFNQALEDILSKVEHITVCIDEVQLFSDMMLEFFRVLSDTKKFTFVFSTHLKDKEDIFSSKHFSSRIANSIILTPVNLKELKIYIEKKLLFYGNFEVANMFSNSNYKLIFKFSQGNYRKINMLLKTVFSILMRYEKNENKIANRSYISNKIIEMAMLSIEKNMDFKNV